MQLKKHVVIVALLMGVCLGFGQNKKEETEFRKLCSEIANAFAKENMVDVNKYINPDAGIFVIIRPGAIDDVISQKKMDEKNPFAIKYPYKDASAVKKHTVKYGEAPKFNCGTMKWNKAGFIADSISHYNRITEIMDFRTKNENAKYSEENISKKDLIEKRMRKVTFTEITKKHGLVFYMSYINGKWYLTVVDITEGLCAA
jgi:hypothetical protein